MYFLEREDKYKVDLWKEKEGALYVLGDSLPLKGLDRNYHMNCFVLNRDFIFKIEWGILEGTENLSYFKNKDLNKFHFYNSFGKILDIKNYKDLERATNNEYPYINTDEDRFKKFGEELNNVYSLHIWERQRYNKSMRTIRAMIRTNESMIKDYLSWVNKDSLGKALQVLEGIVITY